MPAKDQMPRQSASLKAYTVGVTRGADVKGWRGLRRVCTGRVRSTLAVRSLPVRIGVPRRILRTRAPLSLVACGRDMPFWPFRH